MDMYCKKISEINLLLNNNEITSEDLTKDIFEKIEKNNHENYSILNENALEISKKTDTKKGKILSGIPMIVEDSISTRGILTQSGSKILEGYIPVFDAKVVEKLLDEDAILIGKGNLGEFGITSSKNSYKTAKAVMDGEAVFGIMTDTNGEVRLSAAEYGLIGFRPTYGLISRYGIIARVSSLDQIGIISRNIEDLGIVLSKVVGKDERDSSSIEVEDQNYEIIKEEIKDLKIGVPKEYKDKENVEFNVLIENLKKLGAKVDYTDIPSLKYSKASYEIISSAEFASNLAKFDGISYGYRTKEYENIDQIYKKTRTEGFGLEVKEKILFGNFVVNKDNYNDYYENAQKLRARLKKDFEGEFKEFDLILTPVDSESTLGSNLAGLPSMSIPYKENMENFSGFQIIADKFKEEKLLSFAYNYEAEVLDKGGAK